MQERMPFIPIPLNNGLVMLTTDASRKVSFVNQCYKPRLIDVFTLIVDVKSTSPNIPDRYDLTVFFLIELDEEFAQVNPFGLYTSHMHIDYLALWDEQFFCNAGYDIRSAPKPCPKTVRDVFAFSEAFKLQGLLFAFAHNGKLRYLDYDTIGKHNVFTIVKTDQPQYSPQFQVDFTTHIMTGRPITAPLITINELLCRIEQPKIELAFGNFYALLDGQFNNEDLITDIAICETLNYEYSSGDTNHTTLVSVTGHPNLLIEACTRPNTPNIIIMFTAHTIYDTKYIGGVYNVSQGDKKDYVFDTPIPTFKSLITDAAVRNRHLTRKELMPNVKLDIIDDTEITYWINKTNEEFCDSLSFKWCDFSSWFNPAFIRRRELIAKLRGLGTMKFDDSITGLTIEQLEKLAAIF